MTSISLLLVEDFYPNPDEIRELALSSEFTKRENASYPGLEANAKGCNWEPVMEQIRSLVPFERLQMVGHPEYPQGKFHLSFESDSKTRQVGIHVDIARWSAVIYLSKEPDPLGGTTWYKHVPTGQYSDTKEFLEFCYKDLSDPSPEAVRQHIKKISTDMTQWQEIQRVAMVYNRLVLFQANTFHATNYFFGKDKESGRLTQHFIFYD